MKRVNSNGGIGLWDQIRAAMLRRYPFINRREVQAFQRRTAVALKRYAHSGDTYDRFLILEEYFASFHDAHTRILRHPQKQWYGPRDLSARMVDGSILLLCKNKLLGRLLSVNDETTTVLLRWHMRRVSASTTSFRAHQAAKFVLLSHYPARVICRVAHKNVIRIYAEDQRVIVGKADTSVPSLRTLKRSVALLTIPSWSETQKTRSALQRCVRIISQRAPKLLILDFRGNGGGSGNFAAWFVGHFFKQTTHFGSVLERKSTAHIQLKKRALVVMPQHPFLSSKVCILMDTSSMSTTEYCIAGLYDNHRACTVGEQTGGSSGNPKTVLLTMGQRDFSVLISTWRYIRPNGKSLEGVGIRPDYIVRETALNVRHAKDMALEEAMRRCRGNRCDH